MTFEIRRAPWFQLTTTLPYLPGKTTEQVATLRTLLSSLQNDEASYLLRGKEDVRRIQKQLGTVGLTKCIDDTLVLTELGKFWISDPRDDLLCRILHSRTAYFGEALNRVAQNPPTIEELRLDGVTHFLMSWRSTDQAARRLGWFQSLGAVERWPDHRYRVTDVGKEWLQALDIETPETVASLHARRLKRASYAPAPLLLSGMLQGVDHDSRSRALPYLTKEPVRMTSFVVQAATAGSSKSKVSEGLSELLNIRVGSARSAVDAVGQLSLYEYSGKYEISATSLGREWSKNATPLNLVRLLHARFAAIGEALFFLTDSPRSAGEIHRALFPDASSRPQQSRTANVLRLLIAAEAAASIGYSKYVITESGRRLAEELPLRRPISSDESSVSHPISPSATISTPGRSLEDFTRSLEASSRDSNNPERFEKLCAESFERLGLEAKHLGGPGRTDVLVTIRSSFNVIARVIVEVKTSSGNLKEDSVKFDALKEHASKHRASLMVVIAPSFEGTGRLKDWASGNRVVLLTAAELSTLLHSHEEYAYSAKDMAEILAVDGAPDAQIRRQLQLDRLSLIQQVIGDLMTESQQLKPEALSAQGIGHFMRRIGRTVTDEEIEEILAFLAQPGIQVTESTAPGRYVLPSDPTATAKRLHALSRAIANSVQ